MGMGRQCQWSWSARRIGSHVIRIASQSVTSVIALGIIIELNLIEIMVQYIDLADLVISLEVIDSLSTPYSRASAGLGVSAV